MVTHPCTNLYLCCLTSNSLQSIIDVSFFHYISSLRIIFHFYLIFSQNNNDKIWPSLQTNRALLVLAIELKVWVFINDFSLKRNFLNSSLFIASPTVSVTGQVDQSSISLSYRTRTQHAWWSACWNIRNIMLDGNMSPCSVKTLVVLVCKSHNEVILIIFNFTLFRSISTAPLALYHWNLSQNSSNILEWSWRLTSTCSTSTLKIE